MGLPVGASSTQWKEFEKGNFKSVEYYKLDRELDGVRNTKDYDRIQSELDVISKRQIEIGDKRNKLIKERDNLISELERENNQFSSQWTTPDMPFKKTDQWVNLALRRMMRYAAENDFDRIAWTTGEQQADRYDLSKQVDHIAYQQQGIAASDNAPMYNVKVYDKYKTEVISGVYRAEELEDIVGKEIAQKIVNGEGNAPLPGKNLPTYITGLDLKVGGEGMKAFYDNIVPKAVKKLAKPFGANIEVVELPETGQQLSIPVTEKMKESVQEGVPLFRTVSDAAESAGSNMTEELRKEYDQKYNKFATRFREAWEDMYLPVKQFLDVLRENGVEVEEYNDFYKQATFTSGKNDAQLDYFRKTFQKPITEQISNLQKLGFKYRDIENYVFAKHGLERNDFMAKQEARDRYEKDIQDLKKDYKNGKIGEEWAMMLLSIFLP